MKEIKVRVKSKFKTRLYLRQLEVSLKMRRGTISTNISCLLRLHPADPVIVSLSDAPGRVASSVCARNGDGRTANLRSENSKVLYPSVNFLSQQTEVLNAMKGLGAWLERDVYDRQTDLRVVLARINKISDILDAQLSAKDAGPSNNPDVVPEGSNERTPQHAAASRSSSPLMDVLSEGDFY